MELLNAALEYASKGLRVFPLLPRSKKPATKNGFKDASCNEGQIRSWWQQWPDANIGIATGSVSGGLFVVDLDVDEDKGIDGRLTLRKWEAEHGKQLPGDTWLAITGRGGYHYFYHDSAIVRSRTGLYEGIDIRGDGGYIVAPPSIHPNGRRYEWEQPPDLYDVATTDGALFDFLNPEPETWNKTTLKMSEQIPEGERTKMLVKLVCSLQSKGLTDESIRAAVRTENESKCFPPLTEKELEREVFPALNRYQKGTASYQQGSTPKRIPLRPLTLVSMSQIEEKTPEWLIPDYMPRGQITILAGDGGAGKTTIWCAIAGAVSSGTKCFLNHEDPFVGVGQKPGKVLFFSSEDSAEYTLRRRLRQCGATLENIFSISLSDENFSEIKFNSPELEEIIKQERPELVIFDPLQSFIPQDIQMGQRNAMRSCLNPLIGLGEKYGTTFLIIVHTNKQAGLWGRKRIADSADIWDIARSVLIAGDAGDGMRYVSHEKCNYAPQADTVLFRLDTGKIEFGGYTIKKDKDFVSAAAQATYQTPQKDTAKSLLLECLEDGKEKEVAELDDLMKAMGISRNTLSRAKTELRQEGKIKTWSIGYGKEKKFFCRLSDNSHIPSGTLGE